MAGIKNKRITYLKELALQGPTLANGLAVGAMVDVWSMGDDGQVFCCPGVLAALRLTARGVHEFSVGFMLHSVDLAVVLDDVFGVICEPDQINAEQALVLLSDPEAPDTIMLFRTPEEAVGRTNAGNEDDDSAPSNAVATDGEAAPEKKEGLLRKSIYGERSQTAFREMISTDEAATPKVNHLKVVASNIGVSVSDTPASSPALRAVDPIGGTDV
jgi:hypothetical protein